MIVNKSKSKSQNDVELMEAIAQGDLHELGQLYLRHKDKVVALAFRILGHWDRAEDISQEAFLRVYKAAGKYKPDAEFTTWLYKIVVNLCIDERRRIRKSKDLVRAYKYLRANNGDSIKNNDNPEVAFVVRKAILKLNRRQRRVVILHKIEGLSHAEISNRTGWSQSSIESLIVRAYRKLRKELISVYQL